MVNDDKILAKEFIYRYQISKSKNEPNIMEKFFLYATANKEYIKSNESNPIIIDFYHDYYLFLLKNDDKKLANEILLKLYNKQKEVKAFIYSPFVESELARLSKQSSNIQESINYLLESLENTRKIKPNDAVKTYYDILTLYDELGNKAKKDEYLLKCKEVKQTQDSLYKKMCEEMK